MASRATTVTLGMFSTGRPVRGSMMCENHWSPDAEAARVVAAGGHAAGGQVDMTLCSIPGGG